jgi:hypothetical protein
MFVVRMLRTSNPGKPPVEMWLKKTMPPEWGDREDAMRFVTKGDAWQAVSSVQVFGAWTIEEIKSAR